MGAERPLDRIHIRELRTRCIVGVFPEERVKKQDVAISLTMYGDFSRACASDRLEDTIDYKSVKKSVLAMVESSEFNLIERLAEEIAKIALEPPGVQRVEVTVDKPGALRFAKSVAVEIARSKND